MKKQDMHKVLQRGSLMVEALALLGLITMVTPVMYKKAAERTTELQDINIATQMRTLNEALDNYVRKNYNEVKDLVNDGDYEIVSATDTTNQIVEGVNAYLPAGFNLSQSKYFDANNLKFSIKRKDVTDLTSNVRSVFTTAVLAPSLNPITFNRASKIASMIGINGGTIKGSKFQGAQGAWSADPSPWFGVTPTDLKTGSLMSISNEAIAEGTATAAVDTSNLLHRVNDGDLEKNTMETNLLMDGNEIKDIGALFGDGGELTIGSDDSDNLFVKGAAKISSTLDVAGTTTLANTSVGGTLGVTGDTTLANTSVGGTLGVTGDTTLESTLDVTGDTTLNKLTAGETELTSLAVINDATVGGNLTIEGTLISDKLHAKTQLTVGGDTPDSPSVMKVDRDIFNVDSEKASFNGSEFKVNIAHSSGSQLSMTENQTLLKNPTGNVSMELNHDPDNNKTFARLGSDAGEFISDAISNSISMETTDTQFIIGKDSGAPVARLKQKGKNRLLIDSGDTYIESGNNNDMYTKLLLSPEAIGFSKNSTDSTDPTASLSLDAYDKLKVDSENFKLSDDEFRVGAEDFFLDDGGLAIGENLTESRGGRSDPITNPLTQYSPQKVIISRNGYIELAPPSDYGTSGANDGTKAGFIRARRLVSDIPYYDHEHFHGATYDGYELDHPYDYYQVNPAYTSIMNDIKLASRGGARLSDILSDYIIKGIYVGDNTYHAGYIDKGFNIEGDWTSELNGEALIWDVIPIVNGAVKGDVIKANDVTGNTSCAPIDQTGDTPNTNCAIYSCQTADCVASPWMGFVPKPQCPEHYLAVVTNNPIRWRMSEVYYLKEGPEGTEHQNLKTKQSESSKAYNITIRDLKSQMGTDTPDDHERFSYYFKKQNSPKDAFFNIEEETATAGSSHTHKTSATPITFQTNTWLNSSVSAHISSDGSVDGWHILMGFLYKPNDYTDLLEDTGLYGADPDALHWNIFPVYAHEMASIVTTYCSFAPTAGNRWDSNNIESPVLNYNQLNSNTFRDPNTLKREPVDPTPENAGKGEGWAKQVNDPSLPYDDAW